MDEMFHDKWNIRKEKYKINEKLHDRWKVTQLWLKSWKCKVVQKWKLKIKDE
jgi:hypothetical protein